MNSLLILLFAVFIDFLQAAFSAGFMSVASGISAATFGFAAPVAIPLGVAIGFVVNICLSCTLGAMLCFWLASSGMFYKTYLFGGGMLELIPGLDDLPGWTVMAGLCIIRKKAEDGKLPQGAAVAFTALTSSKTLVGKGMTATRNLKQRSQRQLDQTPGFVGEEEFAATRTAQKNRVSMNLQNIDIRAKTSKTPPIETALERTPKPTYAPV